MTNKRISPEERARALFAWCNCNPPSGRPYEHRHGCPAEWNEGAPGFDNVLAAIKAAEVDAWKRGAEWMRRRVHSIDGCRVTVTGEDHGLACDAIHAIEIPSEEP